MNKNFFFLNEENYYLLINHQNDLFFANRQTDTQPETLLFLFEEPNQTLKSITEKVLKNHETSNIFLGFEILFCQCLIK